MSKLNDSLEDAVTDFVVNSDHIRLDDKVLDCVRLILKDQMALQVGAAELPWSRACRQYAGERSQPGRSTIAGESSLVDAYTAAFVNAIYGHGMQYDDVLSASSGHPGSCAIPAALAIAEDMGASIGETVRAIVTGYEVYSRIGILAAPTLIERGWHPHCILSNFGAAAIAARMWKLDRTQTFHALALAASHASGSTEYTSTGGMSKRVHPGIGVQNGLRAAAMARAGITGPERFLTGIKGFFRTFTEKELGPQAANDFSVDGVPQILQVWIKPYCCCAATHGAIDAMRVFRSRIADVARIEVRVPTKSNRVVGNFNKHIYAPRSMTELMFSLPVQVALALLGKGNGYRTHLSFLDGKLDLSESGEILELARRVTVIEASEWDREYEEKWVSEVAVFFQDGTSQRMFIEDSKGTPLNPLSEEEFREKFFDLANEPLGQQGAESLFSAIDALDLVAPIDTLTRYMRRADPPLPKPLARTAVKHPS